MANAAMATMAAPVPSAAGATHRRCDPRAALGSGVEKLTLVCCAGAT
jgi:hypothetical protein